MFTCTQCTEFIKKWLSTLGITLHYINRLHNSSSVVGEIEYPCRHHDALYVDVIGTHPLKFSLANQKALFPDPSNQSAPPI